MASAGPRLCFHCEEKVRVEGDFLCRSCKEEYRKCYECGQRERNHPFKLCTVCYKNLSSGGLGASAPTSVPVLTPAPPVPITTAHLPTTGPKQQQTLIKLNNDQRTFKEITAHFMKEWVKVTKQCPKPPIPTAVYAIQNPPLTKKFHLYGEQLRSDVRKTSNSDLFFHGTKLNCDILTTSECCDDDDCGVCGISKNGFDPALVGKNIPRFQRFGKGIYLAPNSSKCHDYTQGNPQYGFRAQLLCLVACGAKYELLNDNTALVSPPDKFHSVHGKAGGSLNYDEIVVYQAEAVLPQYIVVYELNGVDKIAK